MIRIFSMMLLLSLVFLVVAGDDTTKVDNDTIRIMFKDDVYSKEMPKDYESAVETIKDMEYLFNSLDSTYMVLDTNHSSLKSSFDTLKNEISMYTDSVDNLVNQVDSLDSIILSNEKEVANDIDSLADTATQFIEELSYKKSLNFGLGFGISTGSPNDNYYKDFSLAPIIIYGRVYAGTNIGIYYDKELFLPKFGLFGGFLLR